MAAYRQVYDSRHLQADYQEPGSAPDVRQSSIGYLYFFTSDYLRYLRKKPFCNPLAHPTWKCTTLTCEVPNFFYLTEGLHCTCIFRTCVFRTCVFQYLRFQRPRQILSHFHFFGQVVAFSHKYRSLVWHHAVTELTRVLAATATMRLRNMKVPTTMSISISIAPIILTHWSDSWQAEPTQHNHL